MEKIEEESRAKQGIEMAEQRHRADPESSPPQPIRVKPGASTASDEQEVPVQQPSSPPDLKQDEMSALSDRIVQMRRIREQQNAAAETSKSD